MITSGNLALPAGTAATFTTLPTATCSLALSYAGSGSTWVGFGSGSLSPSRGFLLPSGGIVLPLTGGIAGIPVQAFNAGGGTISWVLSNVLSPGP